MALEDAASHAGVEVDDDEGGFGAAGGVAEVGEGVDGVEGEVIEPGAGEHGGWGEVDDAVEAIFFVVPGDEFGGGFAAATVVEHPDDAVFVGLHADDGVELERFFWGGLADGIVGERFGFAFFIDFDDAVLWILFEADAEQVVAVGGDGESGWGEGELEEGFEGGSFGGGGMEAAEQGEGDDADDG